MSVCASQRGTTRTSDHHLSPLHVPPSLLPLLDLILRPPSLRRCWRTRLQHTRLQHAGEYQRDDARASWIGGYEGEHEHERFQLSTLKSRGGSGLHSSAWRRRKGWSRHKEEEGWRHVSAARLDLYRPGALPPSLHRGPMRLVPALLFLGAIITYLLMDMTGCHGYGLDSETLIIMYGDVMR
jgi:hypothetical protein